jgi:hypothetical protein
MREMSEQKRILDLSPYKFMAMEKVPIFKKVNNNDEEKEIIIGYQDKEIEKEYPTEMIKKEYCDLLGNAGISRRPEFFILGREKHKRNQLADKIESSTNELGGAIRRAHGVLLDRVFDAPTKED